MSQAIVLSGNPSEGFTAVGPFDDFDEAADWADSQVTIGNTWVMTVVSPANYEESEVSGMDAVKKLITDLGLDEPGAPNLDGHTEDDLRQFVQVASRCPGQLGAVLFGEQEDREARRRAVDTLCTYAQLRLQASSLRLVGRIDEAMAVEATMERLYGILPEWGRW